METAASALTIDDFEQRSVEIGHDLQRSSPVVWIDVLNGWFVSPRRLVEQVLIDGETFTSNSPDFKPRHVFGETMLNASGDEHDRHRCPFDPAFRVRIVRERYASTVDAIVGELLDGVHEADTIDLGPDFASPVATATVAATLGLDLDLRQVRSVYDTLALAIGDYRNDPDTMSAAHAAKTIFVDAIREELDRGTAGTDSLIADVLRAGGLERDEVIANALVILFGGIETVESTILNTVWCLLRHPDELNFTLTNGAWLAAVDEAIRVAPPLGFLGRVATKNCTLGEQAITAGEQVFVNIVAANRDPIAIDEPDKFIVARGAPRHYLSFSQGAHFCLGYNLARLEASAAVEALFTRFPDLAAASPLGELRGFSFRRPAGGVRLELHGLGDS